MRISYLTDDFLAVDAGSNQQAEETLRALASARWDGAESRWEVHLSHLPDLLTLFRIPPSKIPAKIMERFERDWITCEARIEVNESTARILGSRVPTADLDALLSFEVPGRVTNFEFLTGSWDGRRHLYDARQFTFPAGFVEDVVALLRERRIRFEVQDERDESAAEPPTTSGLSPADRALLEQICSQRRGVFLRAVRTGEGALLKQLLRCVGGRATVLVPDADSAKQLAGECGGCVLEKAVDLDEPMLFLTAKHGADFILAQEPGAPKISAADRRLALMLGLRMRREQALLLLHGDSAPADGVFALASAAIAARWRVALTRFPTRGDGLDMILRGCFGPTEQAVSAAARVARGELRPVTLSWHRAAEYHQVERDRTPEEILQHGVVENAARHEMLALEAKPGAMVLVTRENFRKKLRAALPATVAVLHPSDVSTAKLPKGAPPVVIIADPPEDPIAVGLALLFLCERDPLASALRVVDFDDPLPVWRRVTDFRRQWYGRLGGWITAETSSPSREVKRLANPMRRPTRSKRRKQ